MTRSLLKSIMTLMLFAAVLVIGLLNLDGISGGISTFFGVLAPFIIGFVIAYVVNIPYSFFYNKVFVKLEQEKKTKRNRFDDFIARLRMPLSLLVSYAICLAVIALLIGIIVPQIIENVQTFINNLTSDYLISFQNWLYSLADRFNIDSEYITNFLTSFNDFIGQYVGSGDGNIDFNTVITNLTEYLFPSLFSITQSVYNVVYNIVIGIVVSIYYLANKKQLCNQCKKVAYALIPRRFLGHVLRIVDLTNNKVGKFIYGKVVDSLIIGVMCYIGLRIMSIDYALLLSVIVGITNIVPFFGPIIGAVPGAILLLLVSPMEALIFVIYVVVLQQIDGNIIGPKILGNSVGISGFWIMFSVLVGGGLFGFAGMILSVPLFAVIYYLAGEYINNRLVKLGFLTKDRVRKDPLPKVAYEDGHIIREKEKPDEQERQIYYDESDDE